MFFMALYLTVPLSAHAAQSGRLAVLISREITPYIQMVEGLEAGLRGFNVQRFFLDEQGLPYSLVATTPELDTADYDVLVSVGPEALRYLQPRSEGVALLYAMVLNPDNVIDPKLPLPCGVSLNLPVEEQLNAIRVSLPQVRRLGVLFDISNNASWYGAACAFSSGKGMQLVPVQVKTKAGNISIVGDYTGLDALLFIPDKSIISKVVIRHVIKTAAAHGVPVVGYNSFFYSSGAAMVFSIDYYKVGEQTAAMVKQVLEDGGCPLNVSPVFEIRTNPIVLKKLKQYRNQTM